MNDEKIIRLAKPLRRGLLRLVFSRFLLIVLLLLFQIGLLAMVYSLLYEYLPYFSVAMGLLEIAMIVYLFNRDMDYSFKLTWMFIVAIAPVAGSMLLLLNYTDTGHRSVQRRVSETIDATRHALSQDPAVMDELKDGGSGLDDLEKYLSRTGCFPVYDRTGVDYFDSGEEQFAAIMEELERAKHFIWLEFFIIQEGYMWGRILEVLTRKAAEGVDVRVMYDGMCESFHLPSNYHRLLNKQGIQAKVFSPVYPVISSYYNYRDHRKILVVDGATAFTGGINLSDEYINRMERFGHWKDTGIRLRGDAVRSFALMFLQMWNTTEAAPDYTLPPFPPSPEEKPGGWVLPYADSPLDRENVGESVYIDMLYRANDYVHIMTPYLILDGKTETALRYAAQRGVDVRIILPGVPDKKLAYALAKTHYPALLNAGVKIYEYTPGFVHSKVFVSDSRKAVVGTINLDFRSLYHHFECAAYLYETGCIRDIEEDFQQTLKKCREVTKESLPEEKLFYRVIGRLMKFFAPLM